jgi:dihydropteroate synthase
MTLLRDLLPDLGRRTLIMGVLNVTPDSFSDGGLYLDPGLAVERARQMRAEGADILDIGGESTRPGAAPVSADEEIRRVVPVIARLRAEVPLPISLDTTKAVVARAGVAAGAHLLNDISGGAMDADMFAVASELQVPLALMHLPVLPRLMGWSQPAQTGGMVPDADVIDAVVAFLFERIRAAEAAGIRREILSSIPDSGSENRSSRISTSPPVA